MKKQYINLLCVFIVLISNSALALAPKDTFDSFQTIIDNILSKDSKKSRDAFTDLDNLQPVEMECIILNIIDKFNLDIKIKNEKSEKGIIFLKKNSIERIGFLDIKINDDKKEIIIDNIQIRFDWQKRRLAPLLFRLFYINFNKYSGYKISSTTVIKNSNGSSSTKAWEIGSLFSPKTKLTGNTARLIGIYPSFKITSRST